VRDLPGDILDRFLAPRWLLGDRYGWEAALVDTLSLRADALAATDARDAAALDPYAFTIEAYHQRRRLAIFDGAPPAVDLLDEAVLDEE
jgi:phospholipid-binding lipoprotein MlaA